MSRVTFIAFLAALCGPVFGQAPGVTSKRILLGQSAAFSGPAAQLGIQMNVGTKVYLDYVNGRGGIYGRKIELKTRDDRYDPPVRAEATKKLTEQDTVFAVISCERPPATGAA